MERPSIMTAARTVIYEPFACQEKTAFARRGDKGYILHVLQLHILDFFNNTNIVLMSIKTTCYQHIKTISELLK